ncbi:MAG: site-specific DNA-methyltransferase [Planctomycetes bacterium]|nr:site-specific DNA-methyltransferase [Planctomycetota bacterium]
MAHKKQKLELTWIGKEDRPRLEPRILIEDPELSYHAPKRVSGKDIFDNLLIRGDNLLSLKALEHEFRGKVRCAFIDPPYNTGSAFKHYDDGLEHSTWLSLMRDRLALIRELLSLDGSIWISIDDNESHYLKVLCDEIFGRTNFVATVVWQKNHARNNSAKYLADDHDFILVYARELDHWRRNKVERTAASDADFWNPDNDPRGEWRRSDLTAAKPYGDGKYEVVGPLGDKFTPRENRWWSLSRESFEELVGDNRIWWGKTRRTFPFRKRFRSELGGLVPNTVWLSGEVGNNREAKQEVTRIFGRDKIFSTPKPERLAERVINIATDPGDLVLDSFAGSGTTGAVAHKLGRKWIMVELEEHAETHIVPRLKQVIDGCDKGGMNAQANWKGGGGFRFLRLADSLLQKDKWDNWVVSKTYRPEMLAEAVCKLEGFRYEPDPEVFWIHGRSTETDFLYVTTQNLSREQLAFLSEQVGPDRTLLICCSAFRAKRDEFGNLTLKKIPQAVLSRCEWGRDDYSLNVEALPPAEAAAELEEDADQAESGEDAPTAGRRRKAKRKAKRKTAMQDLPLLDLMGEGEEAAR